MDNPSDAEVEAAWAAWLSEPSGGLDGMRRVLLAAAAVRARTEVSDAAFSAGVYAVADALCASQYVNAPDASFVLTLAHHAFAAGTAAQTATSTEAK